MTAASLIDWLQRVVLAQPRRPAVFEHGTEWTYRQLWERSAAIAYGLLRCSDFSAGRRVGLLGRNSAEYLAAYLGTMRAGGVVVPLNDRQSPEELSEQLDFVQAVGCLVGDVDGRAEDHLDGDRRLWRLSELEGAGRSPLPASDPDADATIVLTSGSTGAPKGVRHTQAALLHAGLQLAMALPYDRSDVNIAFLPFFASIPEQVVPTLLTGASLDIMARFDVEAVSRACDRATTFDAVPTIMSRLLDDGDPDQLNKLRWIAFASEPMPPPLLERWWNRIPAPDTYEFYGMTEMLPITYAPPSALIAEPSTVGVPYPTSQVEIMGADGSCVESGQEGEVTCVSPALMKGYLDDEAATAAALTAQGAIRTGDLGRFDDQGRLFLTGRLKDLIISGGFNIAPAEIERVACRHPLVTAAAVVGIPDERWGETPIIVAVPARGNSLTPEDLLRYCRENLNGYKRPSGAAIVSALPVTGIGKSAKAELREAIVEGRLELLREN